MGNRSYVAELDEGDYRVRVSAVPRDRGFVASLLVSRIKGVAGAPVLAYCDFALDGGRRWMHPEDALAEAADAGRRLVWDAQFRLGC